MSKKQEKKPFFSCCSAEEVKSDVHVELKNREPIVHTGINQVIQLQWHYQWQFNSQL